MGGAELLEDLSAFGVQVINDGTFEELDEDEVIVIAKEAEQAGNVEKHDAIIERWEEVNEQAVVAE